VQVFLPLTAKTPKPIVLWRLANVVELTGFVHQRWLRGTFSCSSLFTPGLSILLRTLGITANSNPDYDVTFPTPSTSTPCTPTLRHVHQQRLVHHNLGTPTYKLPNVHVCPLLSGQFPEGRGYTWRHKSLQGPVIPNPGLEARDPHSGDGGTCSSILTALIPNVWNDSTSPKARD
jgi:hypothetical protein